MIVSVRERHERRTRMRVAAVERRRRRDIAVKTDVMRGQKMPMTTRMRKRTIDSG